MKKLFKKEHNDDYNSWMSFTDLMSGFLVFFIIASIVAIKDYNDSLKQNAEIAKRLARFTAPTRSIDSIQIRIDSCLIDIYDGEVIDGDTTIVMIYNKETRADSSKIHKNALQNLLQEFKSLEGVYGDVVVELDTLRGSISLRHKGGQELFAPNEAVPVKALTEFLNNYSNLIISKTMSLLANSKDIELRIEGHTDPSWGPEKNYGSKLSFEENLGLSSDRAYEVYRLMLNNPSMSTEQVDFMMNHTIAVGYSFSERKLAGTHKYPDNLTRDSMDKRSRKIEFRIIAR